MKYLFNFIYLFALVLISPKIFYRIFRYGRYRKGWSERLGRIHRPRPDRKCIWIHAVSVGEVNAAKTLVEELKNELPNFEIVITATTDTGCNRAKKLYANEHNVFFFPFDISFIMARAVKNIKPTICLLMELEVWPNLAAITEKKNIPLAVVNGRISDRSFPRYKMVKPFIRKTFQKVNLFLAQTSEYADRFIALGGRPENTIVTGNLKYDTARIADKIDGVDELATALDISTKELWVAGGTGPNEEKIILDVFKKLNGQQCYPNLKLAIVPRKPERFNEVAELIKEFGFGLIRYSEVKKGQKAVPSDSGTVVLGDTMGDLRKFYFLAEIVFVGRTLVPMGGSDMMEPTALGKCTIFGPYTFNFKQTVSALLAGNGAIEIKNGNELFAAMQKCLTDKDYALQIASNGQKIIKENQGATKKSVDAVLKLVNFTQ